MSRTTRMAGAAATPVDRVHITNRSTDEGLVRQEEPMRLTIPVAAGVLVAVFAACAKPVPRDQAKDSRRILLPSTLPSADAVASDLETGRPPQLIQTVLRRAHSSASRPGRSAMAAIASPPVPQTDRKSVV